MLHTLIIVTAILFAGCQGEVADVGQIRKLSGTDLIPPLTPGTPDQKPVPGVDNYEFTVLSGNNQSVQVGAALEKIRVQLLLNGSPVGGAEVLFVPDFFDGGSFDGEVAVATDEAGVADSPIYITGAEPREIILTAEAKLKDLSVLTTTVLASSKRKLQTLSFRGCLSGRAIDTTRIEVSFDFPEGADAVTVRRNGATVFYTSVKPATSVIIDSGLEEGGVYRYTCHANFAGQEIEGDQLLTLSTYINNTPIFGGIDSVVSAGLRGAVVAWLPPSGGPFAARYEVYLATTPEQVFNQVPFGLVSAGEFLFQTPELGDGLDFYFAVRACNRDGVCERNSVVKKIHTSNDGPPRSLGIKSTTIKDGLLVLETPWNSAVGDVLTRRFFYRLKAAAGEFSLVHSESYPVLGVVPQTVSIANLVEGSDLEFYVTEEDRDGMVSSPSIIITVPALDLTAPIFLGATDSVRGADKEHQVVVLFNALDPEPTDPNGASLYTIQILNAVYPGPVNENPCSTGQETEKISASLYVSGNPVSHVISGLQPRNIYRICVKAVDLAGNTSKTTAFTEIITGDTVPPSFNGVSLLSVDGTTGELVVKWTPSAAPDLKEYKIYLWRLEAPGEVSVISVPAAKGGELRLTRADYFFEDNDTVFAQASACDNADLFLNSQSNCSPYASISPKSIKIPDTSPPPGFTGVASSVSQTSPAEGAAIVRWNLPPKTVMKDHYRGFRIYQYDEASGLSFLKDVNCQNESFKRGIANPAGNRDCVTLASIDSAEVTGLPPGKFVKFHVRAYDAAGNETTYLEPNISFAQVKILDLTAPVMDLAFEYSGEFFIWGAAADNQYSVGNQISYQLYRRKTERIDNYSAPEQTGVSLTETTDLRSADPLVTEEGATYNYVLCALDAARNRICLPKNIAVTIVDAVKPVISQQSFRLLSKHAWEFDWQISDNSGIARVEIYRKISAAEDAEWTKTQGVLVKLFNEDEGNLSSGRLSAPPNSSGFANYLVHIYDKYGNLREWRYSHPVNQVAQVLAHSAAEGPIQGQNSIMIETSGYDDNALSVLVGGKPCLSHTKIKPFMLGCMVPPVDGGSPLDVSAVVREYLSEIDGYLQSSFIYRYKDGADCLGAANGSLFQNDFMANGSANNPYLICNAVQFSNIRNAGVKKYFKLGANIDYSLTTSFTSLPSTFLSLVGQKYSIFGFSLNGQPGVFVQVKSDDTFESSVSDLSIFGSTSPSQAPSGLLAGDFGGQLVGVGFYNKMSTLPTTPASTGLDPLFCGGLFGAIRSGSYIYEVKGEFITPETTGCNLGGVAGLVLHNGNLLSSAQRFFTLFKRVTLTLDILSNSNLLGGVVAAVRPVTYYPSILAQANGCTLCQPAPTKLDDFNTGQVMFNNIILKGTISGGVITGGVVGELSSGVASVHFNEIESSLNIRTCAFSGSANGGLVGKTDRASTFSFLDTTKPYYDGVGTTTSTKLTHAYIRNIDLKGSVDTVANCSQGRFDLNFGGIFGEHFQPGDTVISGILNRMSSPGEGYRMKNFVYSSVFNTIGISDSVMVRNGLDQTAASSSITISNTFTLDNGTAAPVLDYWLDLNWSISPAPEDLPIWIFSTGQYPVLSSL